MLAVTDLDGGAHLGLIEDGRRVSVVVQVPLLPALVALQALTGAVLKLL